MTQCCECENFLSETKRGSFHLPGRSGSKQTRLASQSHNIGSVHIMSSSDESVDPLNDDSVLSKWGFDKNYCFHCGKTNSELDGLLMQCGKCHQTYYCSMKCFNADLEAHQKICKTAEYAHKEPDRITAEHMSVSSEKSRSRRAARAEAMAAAGLSPKKSNKLASKNSKLKNSTSSSTKRKSTGIHRSNSGVGSSRGVSAAQSTAAGDSTKKGSSSSSYPSSSTKNVDNAVLNEALTTSNESSGAGGNDANVPIQEILCGNDRHNSDNNGGKNNASWVSLGDPNDASWQMSATSFTSFDKNGASASAATMNMNSSYLSSKSDWTTGENNDDCEHDHEVEEQGRKRMGRSSIPQEDSSRGNSGRNSSVGERAFEADSPVGIGNQALRAVEHEEKLQLSKTKSLSACSVNEEKKEFEWRKPTWTKQLHSLRKTNNGGKLRTGLDVSRPISKGVDSTDN